MKPFSIFSASRLSFPLASALVALLAAPSAHAGTLYWDGGTVNIGTNGNGISGGTAGDWDNITPGDNTANWDQGAGLAHVAWDSANLDTAFFGGTAGNVTLTDPITVGGLGFSSNSGYTIIAGTQGLTFGGATNHVRMLNVSGTTSTAAISGTVTGTGNLVFTSVAPDVNSTLTLNGTSAGGWSGATTINRSTTLLLSGLNQGLNNTSGITLNGGNITLTNADSDAERILSRVKDDAVITSNGGTISYTNTTAASTRVFAETIGSVDLVRGQTNFVNTLDKSAGSQTLTLSGLTRTGATNTSVVTFNNAGGLNITTDVIRVNGIGTSTTAGQIIGPWATYGTSAGSQTDYAVYDSDGTFGRVRNASIGATAQDSGLWVSGANVTLGGATTLTATRTINSLRYTAGALALDLGASNFNLETYGLLNGGSATLTVSTTGTGGLTTPTGGGSLYLTAGAANIAVSAPITDNGGNVTVVKSGSSSLTLSSTASNYSGGTVLNAGTLAIGNVANIGGASANLTFGGTATFAPSAALNFSSGTLTVNAGAYGTITGSGATAFATTTGTGTLRYTSNANSASLNLGNASAFTGNLEYRLTGNAGYSDSSVTVQFSSLGDGVGSVLQVGGGQSDSSAPVGQRANIVFNGGAAMVFNNRVIELLPRIASNHTVGRTQLRNDSANAAHTWTINTDLSVQLTDARFFELAGSNTGNNAFNGVISNGNTGGTISLLKAGSGKWILGGANTFAGTTTINGGTLEVSNLANGGSNSSIGASSNEAGNLRLANSTTLRYTGSGHSTDRSFTLNVATAGHGATIDASGTGAVNFTSTATPGYGTTAQTRTLTLGGTNTNSNTLAASLTNNGGANVSLTKSGAGTWKLTGTNSYSGATAVNGGLLVFGNTGAKSGSAVAAGASGSIGLGVGGAGFYSSADVDSLFANTLAGFTMNAASGVGIDTTAGDFTHASNQGGSRALTKLGANALILSGTNTYSGATTVVEGSLLVNGSTGGSSAVSVASGATLGGTGTIGGAVNVSGVLSPGASIETLGSGTLSFANGSSLVHELDSSVATSVGSDLLKVTGNLNLTGTVGLTLSDLALTDVAFNVDDVFSIINYTGTWNNGLFTFEGNELANASEFTFGLNTWRIDYDATSGGSNFFGEQVAGSFVNLTVLTAVPEPSSVALLGTLGAMMLLRRRR